MDALLTSKCVKFIGSDSRMGWMLDLSACRWTVPKPFGVERLPLRAAERSRLQPERETLSSDPSLYLKDHTSTHQTFADAVGCS